MIRYTYSAGDRPLDGFTIGRALGRGGFGEVYQAVSDGGKVVALKHVQRHLEVELRGVGQCLNVKSPHLVEIIDIRQTPGEDYWIVMEFMDGDSLDRVIARNAQGMPEDLLLTWLVGLCEGVRSLHERGIVHRDLKPGNVFMGQGVVKLGDYGLSKFISASRRSGHTGSIGTVHYMAPEIAQGRYGKEIDLYSIGVMLYEMLTGHVPFDGETAGEILMKHLTAAPDLSGLPQRYRPVVSKLLEKDPAQRYPSVDAMMADLGYTRDSLPRLTNPGIPVLQAVEPTIDWRAPNPPVQANSAVRPRMWLLGVISLLFAFLLALWLAFLGVEVFHLGEATVPFVIGGGILGFFLSSSGFRLLYERRGDTVDKFLSKRTWVERLPGFGRLVLSGAAAGGAALLTAALAAEGGLSEEEGLPMTFVVGSLVLAATLILFFGRGVRQPEAAPVSSSRRGGSKVLEFFRIVFVSASVGLLTGGFLCGVMHRASGVGVFLGIAAGLFCFVFLGIARGVRLFTGVVVAGLLAVAQALVAGGLLAALFRSGETASLAAVGVGLLTFVVILLLWHSLFLPQVERLRLALDRAFGRNRLTAAPGRLGNW